MALSFKELRSNRKDNVQRLAKELDRLNPSKKKTFEKDERFWYPEVDKTGSAQALIRFLPAPKGEDVPFVRYFSYAFQGPTKAWYIENALSTFDKPDPVGEYNSQLWNSGTKEGQAQARAQKRKLVFVSNVLVLQDKANPENNGKVFLFKYGKKIYDMIHLQMFPEFEGVEAIDPFDMEAGADFRFVRKMVDNFPNYSSSSFDKSKTIEMNGKKLTEKEMEALWEKEYSLQELLSDKHFKSYDELKARMEKVLGITNAPRKLVPEKRINNSTSSVLGGDDEGDEPLDLSFMDEGDDE